MLLFVFLSLAGQLHPELRAQTPPGLVIPDIKAEAAKIKAQQAESAHSQPRRALHEHHAALHLRLARSRS